MIGPMKKKVVASIALTAVVMIVIFSIIMAVFAFSTNKTINNLQEKKADAKAYVFTKDLLAGNRITKDDITLVEARNESVASDSYIEGEESQIVGRRLKINARKNMIVTNSVLFEKDEEANIDTRLQEFNMIVLPSDLDEGDYIDVRILFPTGEDYSVLVGKRVEAFGALGAQSNTIFLRLGEEEIVRMGSAIIESYIRDGVKLYANKYVDPANQLFETKHVDLVAEYERVRYKEDDVEDVQTTINESGEIVTIEPEKIEKTPDEIAAELNVSIEDINNIIEAVKNNDNSKLALYKDIEITYKKTDLGTGFVANYPVKPEVAKLIQNNPNILELIRAKYNIAELELERDTLPDTTLEIYDEEKNETTINDDYLKSIKDKLDTEIESQRNERQEYLLNLIADQKNENK